MRRCSVLLAASMLAVSAGAAAQQPADANPEVDDATSTETIQNADAQPDRADATSDVEDEEAHRADSDDKVPSPSTRTLVETESAFEVEEAEDNVPTTREASTTASDGEATENTRSTSRGGGEAWRKMTEAELAKPNTSYPYIETHGYFRFRTDSFWRLDLGTKGTSSQLPPLEAMLNANSYPGGGMADFNQSITTGDGDSISLSSYARDKAKFISSANIRLRLNPIIHVAQGASVHVQLDILDNLILGSTPYTGDHPMAFFSDTQRSPTAAEFGREAVRISAAYGELKTFVGTLRVGRMPNHWGMGMMFNSGGHYSSVRQPALSRRSLGMAGNTCLDCDHGDYVDRASFTTSVFGHHIMLAYDYSLAGVTQGADDTFGRPRDLGQFDDAQSFVLSIAKRPENAEEVALRNRRLTEQNAPVFDYGLYMMYRRQRIESRSTSTTVAGDPSTYEYMPRGAQMFVPNLWFRLEHQPSNYKRLRIEGEIAGVVGNMKYGANTLAPADRNVDRKIRQIAAALEIDYTNFAWTVGANAGFASGRKASGNPGLGANYDTDLAADERFTAFFFDRDYFVDNIMFREIIGTITNAIYINPFFQYDLFSKRADSLGLRLDFIGAMAANPASTPSGKSFYGAEADLTVFYRQPRYGADISAGVFLPGNAFNGVEGRPRLQDAQRYFGDNYSSSYLANEGVGAKPAYTLQARFFWAF